MLDSGPREAESQPTFPEGRTIDGNDATNATGETNPGGPAEGPAPGEPKAPQIEGLIVKLVIEGCITRSGLNLLRQVLKQGWLDGPEAAGKRAELVGVLSRRLRAGGISKVLTASIVKTLKLIKPSETAGHVTAPWVPPPGTETERRPQRSTRRRRWRMTKRQCR